MSIQMPFGQHDGSMMGWHWGWGLFWLVIAALVVWGVARAMSSGGRPSADAGQSDAEESLRRRFADGEITREEFEERLKVLRDSK